MFYNARPDHTFKNTLKITDNCDFEGKAFVWISKRPIL